MATIKSFTDLEQSKKLAEILPIESADMFCADVFNKEKETHSYNFHILSTWGCNTFEELKDRENKFVSFTPVWSLAALLKLIPNFNMFKRTIECRIETTNHLVDKACEPIDAAFEMICWLKEHNKI